MQLHGAVMAGRTGSRMSNTPVVTNTRRLSSATCPRDRVDWRAESPARTAWRCTTSRKASPRCTGPTRECGHMHAEGAGQRRDRRQASGRTALRGQALQRAPGHSARTGRAHVGEERIGANTGSHQHHSVASASQAAQAVARRRMAARGEVPLLGSLCAALGARARRQVHAGTRAREHAAHPWPAVGHRQRRSDWKENAAAKKLQRNILRSHFISVEGLRTGAAYSESWTHKGYSCHGVFHAHIYVSWYTAAYHRRA
jgi:hypothetical protein